jgi:epoxide hydrolase-like predicted phosphatase
VSVTQSAEIKAIVWDLGGVILRTEDQSYRERWEDHLSLEPWELSKIVFRNDASKKASLGKASADDVWGAVQRQLDLSGEALKSLKKDFFAGDRVDGELIEFIRDLRPRYQTGMITNAWPETRDWIENEHQIGDAFDLIVISSEVGIAKPHPQIYHHFLERMGIRPGEAIFIDDFIENVEGARAVGMESVHFRGPADIVQRIAERLEMD